MNPSMLSNDSRRHSYLVATLDVAQIAADDFGVICTEEALVRRACGIDMACRNESMTDDAKKRVEAMVMNRILTDCAMVARVR